MGNEAVHVLVIHKSRLSSDPTLRFWGFFGFLCLVFFFLCIKLLHL